MPKAKLIVIDDEQDLAGFVCDVADRAGFESFKFTNAGIFKKEYKRCADVIVLDLMMPGVDGVEIIRFLAEINSDVKLILMSGFDSGVLHSAQKLANEHGLDFVGSLSKPFRATELESLLKSLTISVKNVKAPTITKPLTQQELTTAIKEKQLVAYFQPKISLNQEKYYAVETLVRWQHPTLGLIFPDRFIPLAESSGLIDPLTWEVLEQTMRLCQFFSEKGIVLNAAVNMSAITLKELDLPERIGQLCQKFQINPSQIILEITESALMQELVTSLDILTRLRMKGFRLSIDDFGTGYSSMVQLHRAPFSEIKIDRSFISEMESDKEAKAIVETIIMLGHKLNMKVVAEGVETQSCQKILQSLHCDQAQGYYFSKPIPKEQLIKWFSN